MGELNSLVSGVEHLEKILSNVKRRGILGEVQLGNIIEDILNKSQYEENVATQPGSANRVEFAVKLPGKGDGIVYLPIDAKFPADVYGSYLAAGEKGNREEIEEAGKILDRAVKKSGRDIKNKYIAPPFTTDFAVMFIPFEGLYISIVERGLLEVLQREYKVMIAGPGTMGALLNSLQIGFRTLEIEKKAGEVWEILNRVKKEFIAFEAGLTETEKRLNQASAELDKLVGVRTRAINRALDKIERDEDPPHYG